MTGTIRTTTVNGKEFKVWSDFIKVGTFAKDENGVVKQIKSSGYIKNDLPTRKAIQNAFGLDTFRK